MYVGRPEVVNTLWSSRGRPPSRWDAFPGADRCRRRGRGPGRDRPCDPRRSLRHDGDLGATPPASLPAQARRDWAGPELADRLEVSDRTIRAPSSGCANRVTPSTRSRARRAAIACAPAAPPCHRCCSTTTTAIAIAVGLRTVAHALVTGIDETAVPAVVKLEQVLPRHLRRVQPWAALVPRRLVP